MEPMSSRIRKIENYEKECADHAIDTVSSLKGRIKTLEAEIQEVSDQLSDLYELYSEPAVYGAILGLHERLEKVLR